jgi:hypothetical protein
MQGNNNKKVLYFTVIAVMLAMCVYGIWQNKKWANSEGVYIIGVVEKLDLARNGWKIQRAYSFSNKIYRNSAVYPFEYFNKNDVGHRFFLRILRTTPEDGAALIPIGVPDSITASPVDGWSEEWMNEHFPKVVEYIRG